MFLVISRLVGIQFLYRHLTCSFRATDPLLGVPMFLVISRLVGIQFYKGIRKIAIAPDYGIIF